MNCHECGADIFNVVSFCPHCGARLGTAAVEKAMQRRAPSVDAVQQVVEAKAEPENGISRKIKRIPLVVFAIFEAVALFYVTILMNGSPTINAIFNSTTFKSRWIILLPLAVKIKFFAVLFVFAVSAWWSHIAYRLWATYVLFSSNGNWTIRISDWAFDGGALIFAVGVFIASLLAHNEKYLNR